MAAIVKKVYPLGGGDYTSVASALSLITHSAGDDVILLCGPGNVGVISNISQTYNSITVQADSGYKHDGTTNSLTSAVASLTTQNAYADQSGSALIIDGIFFSRTASVLIEAYNDNSGPTTNLTIKNCLIKFASTAANYVAIIADPDGGTTNLTVINTAFCINATTSGFVGIHAAPAGGAAGATVNLVANFNSGANSNATTGNVTAFIHADAQADLSGASTVNVSCQNNAFCNSAADFKSSHSVGTVTVAVAGHNVSADATSTVFGGTGNLTAKSAATCFKTPASDLHMAVASPLSAAGVALGGITSDNQGQRRPSIPSIGAFEFVVANGDASGSFRRIVPHEIQFNQFQ